MDDRDVSMNNTAAGNNEPTTNFFNGLGCTINQAPDNELGDHLGSPYTFGCQTKHPDSDTLGAQSDRVTKTTINIKPTYNNEKDCSQCVGAVEPFCHVKIVSCRIIT